MEISIEKLRALSERYGDAFYLLDSKQFEDNYQRLKRAYIRILTLPILIKPTIFESFAKLWIAVEDTQRLYQTWRWRLHLESE